MPTKLPRSRGRPRLPEAKSRTDFLAVRLTTAERIKLKERAASEQMSESEWAREVLLNRDTPAPANSALKLAARLRSIPGSETPSLNSDTAWCGFLRFYQQCEDVARIAPANLSVKQKAIDADHVSSLINAFQMLAKCTRQVALERKLPGIIDVLVNSCMGCCHLLTHESLRTAVSRVAEHHACFPVLMYSQTIFNRRWKAFLNQIGLGKRVQGLRSEAKWTDDEFFRTALPIVDHVTWLVGVWTHNKLNIALTTSEKDCLNVLLRFSKSLMNGLRAPKNVQDETWKVIDEVIVGKRSSQVLKNRSNLSFDYSWEDFFENKKLREAVSNACSSGKRSPNAEIKKRIKEKFFALFDKPI